MMNETYKKFFSISGYVLGFFIVIFILIDFNNISILYSENDINQLGSTLFGYIGKSISATSIFMLIFNNFLWKNKLINKILGNVPVFSKKYSGFIKRVLNENKIQETRVSLEIRQTFLNCKIHLYSDESESNSIFGFIETINGEKQLVYMYLNEPKLEVRKKSPMHYGTTVLRIRDSSIKGDYYTDRGTFGSIELEEHE